MIVRVALDRYNDELRQMPASGGGGCHSALLRVANFGRLAGVNPNQVAQDLAAHVHGARKVSRGEIRRRSIRRSIPCPHLHHVPPCARPWTAQSC